MGTIPDSFDDDISEEDGEKVRGELKVSNSEASAVNDGVIEISEAGPSTSHSSEVYNAY